MPKYDYRCDHCSDVAEFRFSIHETLPLEILHLECVGHYKRMYNPTPAVFKGQGWAKMTEYKPKKG